MNTTALLLLTLSLAPEGGVDEEGFIRTWLALAPIPFPHEPTGKAPILARQVPDEATMRPVAGRRVRLVDRTLIWQEHQAPEPAIDFARFVDPGRALEAAGYAVTYLVSDAERELTVALASSDQARVYLGGRSVFLHDRPRDWAPEQDRFTVRLPRGTTPLVFKVVNTGGSWKGSLRLLSADGRPAPIQVAVNPRLDASDRFSLDAEGYVRSWLLLAPIPYVPPVVGDGQLARQQLPGEARLRPRAGEAVKVGERTLAWKLVRSEDRALDLAAVVGPGAWNAVAGYAVAYVVSPRDRAGLKLKMGSNDQAKVYLNGQAVLTFDAPRALRPDQDVAGGISLRRGVNVVVFKILNTERKWQGTLRFTDAADRPVTDLRAAAGPDAP